MPHVKLHTPLSNDRSRQSSDIDRQREVVQRWRGERIVATTTPYAPSYARLTPRIRNSLREIRALG
jgi:hypothetical protein